MAARLRSNPLIQAATSRIQSSDPTQIKSEHPASKLRHPAPFEYIKQSGHGQHHPIQGTGSSVNKASRSRSRAHSDRVHQQSRTEAGKSRFGAHGRSRSDGTSGYAMATSREGSFTTLRIKHGQGIQLSHVSAGNTLASIPNRAHTAKRFRSELEAGFKASLRETKLQRRGV
ncbi:hypothetical protein ACLOJK_040472 [Asimina triloba]